MEAKTKRRQSLKEKNGIQLLKIKLSPSSQPKLGRIYSNYIQVAHSPWDFTLRFCDAPPGSDLPTLVKDGIVEIPHLIDIIIPVNLMPGLIKALQDNYDMYLKNVERDKENIL
jgi:hypothetical protein